LTPKYIRFIGEKDFKIPWFEIILPDGTAYPSAPVEIFNPKDPQNPKDGNEKLILFPAFFLGEMTAEQRSFFSNQYLKPSEFHALFKQRVLILAQEGGYFSKDDIGNWSDFFKNPASLDSLLGMEGNDVTKIKWKPGDFDFSVNIPYWLGNVNDKNMIAEITFDTDLIPLELQGMVFVISP
jgi:hypothetical protein